MQINRTNFWSRNNFFWKVPMSHIIQNHWINKLYLELFSFNLTVGHIQLDKFCLWNFLWTSNTYRLLAQKVFLFQMLRQTSLFTLQAKWHFDKNVNIMFCVAMWMWMSPLPYWNLNSSSKILVLQWLLGLMLVYCSQKVKWYTFPKRFV